ncbi:MAG: hypothetical protein ABEJ99_03235 [Candidatus Nanohaloarchaea archaeon]
MSWFNRQIDKLLDSLEMRGVEEVEIYGDNSGGYFIEYGDRIREFDSGKELISFYNDRIRDRLDREPLSVIGNTSETVKEYLHDRGDSALVHKDGSWAVDVFNTAKNYASTAEMKANRDASAVTHLAPSDTEEDVEKKLTRYFQEAKELEEVNPVERFDQHIINAVSGTITQAIVESETELKGETDIEYLIHQIEELE